MLTERKCLIAIIKQQPVPIWLPCQPIWMKVRKEHKNNSKGYKKSNPTMNNPVL
jgi:hypothetical protein